MRSLRILLTWACLLAVIAAVVWGSFELKERFGHEEEEEHPEEEKKKAALDEETMERMGLETASLAAASWREQTEAFGRVVDPSPLVALANERRAAEAALHTSQAEVARSRKLATSENIAVKALEQAEAAEAADRLKLQFAEQRFLLEWGPVIDKDREALIEGVLSGNTVLVRAEPRTPAVFEKVPQSARVIISRKTDPVEATVLGPAPAVDAKSQAPAWFLKIEKPAQPVPPGLSVNVELVTGEKEATGVLIPADSVMHFQGAAWVFVAGKEKGRFERKAIPLEHALKGGWFAAGEFKPGDKVVTTGAASLLAEELKSQIEGD